ncbi:MAG: baseplate J/gp47 family protein [Candidatus Paraimprobicoccus trichonymphae]|uniref:Baseplate J/gp47 family protein n=1 Tax=Candidatus Paraimprobicoccus trichonymphae TaxID=3033793 RepID=A0AA48I0I5_9FIRM|nr:MAG: baseplate J/gp47 family protein [Candidatus Paraimprobicoccus trichonymphae]
MRNLPKFDDRNYDILFDDLKELAKSYTPEWNFEDDNSDFGIVFSKIYCKMLENTITRYNNTCYNYYLTFLNMIGTRLEPASPSSGTIIVDSMANTYIKKGSELFGKADTETGNVVFQTLGSLSTVNTEIKKIFFTDGSLDIVNDIFGKTEKLKPFRIFDNFHYKNLQKHEIYFWDEIVFNTKKSEIEFLFFNDFSKLKEKEFSGIFSDVNNVIWYYYSLNNNWKKIKIIEKTELGVKLKFDDKTNFFNINNINSRFIKCVFKKIPKDNISVTSIKYKSSSQKIPPDYIYSSDYSASNIDFFPFGENFNLSNSFYVSSEEAFSKKNSEISMDISFQFLKIKSTLNVQSNINYRAVMSDLDFAEAEPSNVEIERVTWEYWNGLGWANLVIDEFSKEFFNSPEVSKSKEIRKILKFKCPENIQKILIGATESYFIRCKIAKISHQFDLFADYISPYIHDIFLNYRYSAEGHNCEKIIVDSNLEMKEINFDNIRETTILEKTFTQCPTVYICLTNPLDSKGPVRLFLDIEYKVYKKNPILKWEYCAQGDKKDYTWKDLEVMDLTHNISHSETVTLMGKNDFKNVNFFNTTGYFIRILNPNMKYCRTKLEAKPVIKDILFNAVNVIQKEERQPEYFFINKNEENKICKLSSADISDIKVWVNESGQISTSDQEYFLKNCLKTETFTEYNNSGNIEKFWVKWSPINSIVGAGNDDRVYEIDYSKGEILFGNGTHGKIPTSQYSESIKITYSICNGSKGNLEPNNIKDFVNSYLGVTGVNNPSSIMGGTDIETVEDASERMFNKISSGNRLVTLSDFERSIKLNDKNIYKVKCVSHVDSNNQPNIGKISICILPIKFMNGHEKFEIIRKRIWNFIERKAPINLVNSNRIKIFEVNYIETSVLLDIVIQDYNYYQTVNQEISKKLEQFLNPITGNFSGKGWEIGTFPRKEFIYNYIKKIENITWIKNIDIFTYMVTQEGKKEIEPKNIKNRNFVVPIFGEPKTNISLR